jgi:TRAP-type mannitol/chloroaromatic compound transport system permease small subunit
MNAEQAAIIAEKRSYRRRRLVDAARLLPAFGVVFFSIPLLWSNMQGAEAGGETSTTSAMLYIFGIWALLVIASAVISWRLRPDGGDNDPPMQG